MQTKSFEFGPEDNYRLRGVGVATDGHVRGDDPARPMSTVDRMIERNGRLVEQRVADAETMASLRCDLQHARELALMLAIFCAGMIVVVIWRCL